VGDKRLLHLRIEWLNADLTCGDLVAGQMHKYQSYHRRPSNKALEEEQVLFDYSKTLHNSRDSKRISRQLQETDGEQGVHSKATIL